VGSDWSEGIEPWSFGSRFDLSEAKPLLRGSVFSDRGVYRLGEEVHLKAILRSDTARGILLLPAGTKVAVALRDSQGDERDQRTLTLGEWSSAEWTLTLPGQAPLGRYQVSARVEGQEREVDGGFLVAAYRRPDFRVDVNLAGESSLAGVGLKGVVEARYLFGAPMSGRPARWTYSKTPQYDVPLAVTERFPADKWVFVDEDDERRPSPETIQTKEDALDAQGRLSLELATDRPAGRPYLYTLEGEVTDVSRQAIAGRASFRVDPAPWYLGVKRPAYFADTKTGLDTELVAAELSGRAAAGVPMHVTLTRVQWHSVRRAEGGGFYTWETERKEVPAGSWELTSGEAPVPLHLPLEEGGYYVVRARAADADGRSTTTATGFYALGPGYTAWARYDHNRIDLVPEKRTYRPGETARIMIQSPWEKATALLTTEREGVRTSRPFELTSTQQTVSVPIIEADVPNLFVSVLLVKGRTGTYSDKDTSDPGKPAFKLGYVELRVEDAAKRLAVGVKADREEYRPASRAHVEVTVRDHEDRPASAEVTLWAVDYGVLSLTGYRTPDVLRSVWVEKALQVMNGDSRQRIISRRALTPKGADEGGGGGYAAGESTDVRKDFRVLAFWLGSLTTDASGRAAADVVLPESLTTYRIMAVAADRSSRFGSAQAEIRTSKPVLLKPAFPRFLARGDTALFGAVVHSQLKEKGTAIVTLRSLDPAILEAAGEVRRTVTMAPGSAAEVRFPVRARAVGRGRLQMAVRLLGESDAFEEAIPVEVLASPEVVAAYGQANPQAHETVELPSGAVPEYGGLHVELSSTALVGLGEGARYLVEYPYGCAEQRASAALALLLAADLGDAFRLPGIEPARIKTVARDALKELEAFQCPANGGFAFWKGECESVSPYLTSYVLHVLQRGAKLGHPVSAPVMERAYAYLEQALAGEKPTNEGWWPAYTAWQAFAVKVLSEGGRNADSHFNRLYGHLDRMPVFALAYLLDALAARGLTSHEQGGSGGAGGPTQLQSERGFTSREREDLLRRIKNAVLPEAGLAHVEELSDPYLLWFWNSNVRSTAVVLGSLARAHSLRRTGDDSLAPAMARWLVRARTKGRWGNTQENGVAMEALVDYYKRYEAEVPDFTAVVSLDARELARDVFTGRSSEARPHDVPMKDLLRRGPEGGKLDLAFERQGTGTLHYVARLKYAIDAPSLAGLDKGFLVERRYESAKADDATAEATSFKAGDLVRVTLTFRLPKERRFVAVTDPLPAGFEPVESWFATTATDLAREQQGEESQQGDWERWWEKGGFDHVERHDDRVLLFATRLAEGEHVFSYVARATTVGTFRTAPARAEEMYEPEVFGRTESDVIEVKP
jgi:alpha-2-macroglobulin